MIIKVFGPECRHCTSTEDAVEAALKKVGIDAQVIKISDIDEFLINNINAVPTVMVDGVIKLEGKIPNEEEMTKLLEKYN